MATIAQEGCDIKATHESPSHWSRADGFFFDRWNVRVDFEYGNGYNGGGTESHHIVGSKISVIATDASTSGLDSAPVRMVT